jgi:hypothetical protein
MYKKKCNDGDTVTLYETEAAAKRSLEKAYSPVIFETYITRFGNNIPSYGLAYFALPKGYPLSQYKKELYENGIEIHDTKAVSQWIIDRWVPIVDK